MVVGSNYTGAEKFRVVTDPAVGSNYRIIRGIVHELLESLNAPLLIFFNFLIKCFIHQVCHVTRK